MKIAVIGLYYASNLGDAVICDNVAYLLKKEIPSATIDVIDIEGKSEFPKQYRTSIRVMIRRKMRLEREYRETKQNIKDWVYHWNQIDVGSEERQLFYDRLGENGYDVVVFAGGQLFMDWLSVDICEILKRFEEKNIPVYFNACGAGFAISENIRKLLSTHLQKDHIKMISSRDDVELIKTRYLENQGQVIKTYDPALWTKETYGIENAKEDVLGLGIMYSSHASLWKITRFWVRLIRELDKRQVKWKMFCNGAKEDYDYGCFVLKLLGKRPEDYICEYASTPRELVSQISKFKSIISFRLHSHIIATALDIPAVAIVWDDKLRFFYRNLKHEERCKTIMDKPGDVLKAWELAETQGYDSDLIQKQKEFAKELLVNAIAGEFKYE